MDVSCACLLSRSASSPRSEIGARPKMQRWRDRPGTPLSRRRGTRTRNGIKTPQNKVCHTSAAAQPIFPICIYIILRCTKPTLRSKTASRFVQYLISYITALLALTRQPRQYPGSTFPESADHIPLSVSHEGSVRATKAGCEKKNKKKKHSGVFIISSLRSP